MYGVLYRLVWILYLGCIGYGSAFVYLVVLNSCYEMKVGNYLGMFRFECYGALAMCMIICEHE